MDSPLAPLVSAWIEKISKATEFKHTVFGKDAEECMRFFNGPYSWLYGERKNRTGPSGGSEDDSTFARPGFEMSVNKVAEMAQIFGPYMYQKNPIRVIKPRQNTIVDVGEIPPIQDPTFMQVMSFAAEQSVYSNMKRNVCSRLLSGYLNYTPMELDLKTQSRMAITEAIIKGMGVLWTEIVSMPGTGQKMAGSFYDSVDNLILDPDGETIEECKWIARRCIHPIWEVEREYGLKPGTLKGNLESWNSKFESDPDHLRSYWRSQGLTNDMICYYKIYSKMGMGSRMAPVNDSGTAGKPVMDAMESVLSRYGDYCFLAVAMDTNFPLNLPVDVTANAPDEEIYNRVQWPAPYWADRKWPFQEIVFHRVPRCCWPMSHLKPGLGELKFLNWAYSFVAGKLRTTCRDFIAIAKQASDEIKAAIQSGGDLSMLEMDVVSGQRIQDLVQFLQHPPMQSDLWNVVQDIAASFERRVGLSDLLYGEEGSTQTRSASEAEIKNRNSQTRPADMAECVEEAMSQVAKREAILTRTIITGQDVVTILGPQAAYLWDQFVRTENLAEMFHQLDYTIEAGSTRKPNRERDAQNMNQAMQNLFQPLLNFAMQTADFGPVNQLIKDWAETIDLNASAYKFAIPQPPPQQAAPPQQGPPQVPQ
ncbi:MAG: hypothetical protein HC888_00525 [Candidatus Competibacteraceae bacterium]|nr:hypothetical protein [Candidatus Competibacteraceae bacterium]